MPVLKYHHYFQLISVVTGLIFIYLVWERKMIFFFLTCLAGTFVDILSGWVISAGYKSNYFIINLYPLLSVPLILIAYYRHLKLSIKNKRLYRMAAILIFSGFILNYLIGEGPIRLNTFTAIFFYFTNILLSCGMLFKLAMREDFFIFTNEPLFWISAGLLIFSLGALVTMGLNQFIRINHITIHNKTLYRVIMPMLNVILYLSFTYAFILCKRKKKSYSPSSS